METILNFLSSRCKIFIYLDIIIIFILITLYICANTFNQPLRLNFQILVADNSLQVTPSELSAHNLNLISTLQSRESSGVNAIISGNNGLTQTRNIYIGIIGVLLTFVFSRKGDYKIYLVILSLIILFYGLDIHLSDLIQRSTEFNAVNSRSLELKVRLSPTDNT
jgi:hypothetical protein